MSEVNYASGTGVCKTCGQQLLQVEDDGSKLCIVCKSKRLVEGGLQVPQASANEEQVNKVLAAAGISVKPAAKPQTVPQGAPVFDAPISATFEGSVLKALGIMNNLPMPKDIKQFKTISKIITQMESLLEKKNG